MSRVGRVLGREEVTLEVCWIETSITIRRGPGPARRDVSRPLAEVVLVALRVVAAVRETRALGDFVSPIRDVFAIAEGGVRVMPGRLETGEQIVRLKVLACPRGVPFYTAPGCSFGHHSRYYLEEL